MYLCMFIYVYMKNIHIHIYIYMYVFINVYVYAHVYLCIYTCIYLCVYIHTHYVCAQAYIHTHAFTSTHACIHRYACTFATHHREREHMTYYSLITAYVGHLLERHPTHFCTLNPPLPLGPIVTDNSLAPPFEGCCSRKIRGASPREQSYSRAWTIM